MIRLSKLMPSTRSNSYCARSWLASTLSDIALALAAASFAVLLPAYASQLCLHFAGMVFGNHHMAFLVPFDIGREGIPDQPGIAIRLCALTPAWQDHPGLNIYRYLDDLAAALAFGVGQARREFHLRSAWMALACVHDMRTAPDRVPSRSPRVSCRRWKSSCRFCSRWQRRRGTTDRRRRKHVKMIFFIA